MRSTTSNKPSAPREVFELVHVPTGTVIAREIVHPRGFVAQGIGLLGRHGLASGEGLWLDNTGWVHTLCMRFPLDLLFLDPSSNTVGWDLSVPPNRVLAGRRGAKSTIELAAGTLDQVHGLANGDSWLLRPARTAP